MWNGDNFLSQAREFLLILHVGLFAMRLADLLNRIPKS